PVRCLAVVDGHREALVLDVNAAERSELVERQAPGPHLPSPVPAATVAADPLHAVVPDQCDRPQAARQCAEVPACPPGDEGGRTAAGHLAEARPGGKVHPSLARSLGEGDERAVPVEGQQRLVPEEPGQPCPATGGEERTHGKEVRAATTSILPPRILSPGS